MALRTALARAAITVTLAGTTLATCGVTAAQAAPVTVQQSANPCVTALQALNQIVKHRAVTPKAWRLLALFHRQVLASGDLVLLYYADMLRSAESSGDARAVYYRLVGIVQSCDRRGWI